MELKIQRWGKTAAVRLPGVLLEQINASIGNSPSVSVRPDGVLLTTIRRKYSLDDLVAQCDAKAPFPTNMTG